MLAYDYERVTEPVTTAGVPCSMLPLGICHAPSGATDAVLRATIFEAGARAGLSYHLCRSCAEEGGDL